MTDPHKHFAPVLLLHEREYECFQALGRGLTRPEIAAMNGRKVTLKTVHTLLASARDRMNLKDRNALLALAAQYHYAGLKRVPIVGARYTFEP